MLPCQFQDSYACSNTSNLVELAKKASHFAHANPQRKESSSYVKRHCHVAISNSLIGLRLDRRRFDCCCITNNEVIVSRFFGCVLTAKTTGVVVSHASCSVASPKGKRSAKLDRALRVKEQCEHDLEKFFASKRRETRPPASPRLFDDSYASDQDSAYDRALRGKAPACAL